MKKILILCTGNSCRSQMAEGYMRKFAGSKAEVYSAGIEKHGVNPLAIITMANDGIDISSHTSNTIEEYRNIDFDFVITVCDHASEMCPIFPSKSKIFHQNFPDPAKVKGTKIEIEKEFERIRNLIKAYCNTFVTQNL